MIELLILSILIILAFGVAIVIDRFGVPRATSYIVIGILTSPHLLGKFFKFPYLALSENITEIALGVIAFLIGLKIDWKFLQAKKTSLIYGTLGQVFLAVISVGLTIYIFGYLFDYPNKLKLAVALGAIAATTAPAGTMAVIEEYGAKGAITSLLLGIVILDDVFGVMIFEILTNLTNVGSTFEKLYPSLHHILGSIVLGGCLGCIAGLFSRFFKKAELRFPVFISFVLACTAAASLLGMSSILACISLGFATQITSNQETKNLIGPIKHIEEFVFIIFFIFAGLHFDPSVFSSNLGLILVYIIARSFGKYFGSYWGVLRGGTPRNSAKWLGLCLFPQAGVALGLALSLSHRADYASEAGLVINVILGATIVYETLGPILAKYSLVKSGDIKK
ncbi:MAG: hypothetical protein HOE90_09395 [Bacteriovoracaceae bacterium]|jgi:Kef-type K+ transport system membrane component KefB|nr:hypothetical protein [Bacteriovoracaceae bacterium]